MGAYTIMLFSSSPMFMFEHPHGNQLNFQEAKCTQLSKLVGNNTELKKVM